jgi:hypothetical protein
VLSRSPCPPRRPLQLVAQSLEEPLDQLLSSRHLPLALGYHSVLVFGFLFLLEVLELCSQAPRVEGVIPDLEFEVLHLRMVDRADAGCAGDTSKPLSHPSSSRRRPLTLSSKVWMASGPPPIGQSFSLEARWLRSSPHVVISGAAAGPSESGKTIDAEVGSPVRRCSGTCCFFDSGGAEIG